MFFNYNFFCNICQISIVQYFSKQKKNKHPKVSLISVKKSFSSIGCTGAEKRGRFWTFFVKKMVLRKTQNKIEFRFFAKYFFFSQIDRGHFKVYLSTKTKNRVFRDRGSRTSGFSRSKHCERKFFFRRSIEDTSKYIYQWKTKNRKNFVFHVRKGGGSP